MLLDRIFVRFDELVKEAGALKIETVAGVYVVAANGAQPTAHCIWGLCKGASFDRVEGSRPAGPGGGREPNPT